MSEEQMKNMSDVVATQVEATTNRESTSEEVATAVLEKCAIDKESLFYLPLKQSAQRGVLLSQALGLAKEKAKTDMLYIEVVESISKLVAENDDTIVAKQMHYNKYANQTKASPEILIDENGNSYYERIMPLGSQSIRATKRLLQAVKSGELEAVPGISEMISDCVSRDNYCARFLAERDNVDFSPKPKRYTSPDGSLRQFYKKNEQGVKKARAFIGVALKLVKQDYIGAVVDVVKEIKKAVDDKKELIREKEEISEEIDGVLEAFLDNLKKDEKHTHRENRGMKRKDLEI